MPSLFTRDSCTLSRRRAVAGICIPLHEAHGAHDRTRPVDPSDERVRVRSHARVCVRRRECAATALLCLRGDGRVIQLSPRLHLPCSDRTSNRTRRVCSLLQASFLSSFFLSSSLSLSPFPVPSLSLLCAALRFPDCDDGVEEGWRGRSRKDRPIHCRRLSPPPYKSAQNKQTSPRPLPHFLGLRKLIQKNRWLRGHTTKSSFIRL